MKISTAYTGFRSILGRLVFNNSIPTLSPQWLITLNILLTDSRTLNADFNSYTYGFYKQQRRVNVCTYFLKYFTFKFFLLYVNKKPKRALHTNVIGYIIKNEENVKEKCIHDQN